jgi:hypothetical protein
MAKTAFVTGGTGFSSDNAIRELGYQVRPMEVAIGDNYAWLVKEGLLAEPR